MGNGDCELELCLEVMFTHTHSGTSIKSRTSLEFILFQHTASVTQKTPFLEKGLPLGEAGVFCIQMCCLIGETRFDSIETPNLTYWVRTHSNRALWNDAHDSMTELCHYFYFRNLQKTGCLHLGVYYTRLPSQCDGVWGTVKVRHEHCWPSVISFISYFFKRSF